MSENCVPMSEYEWDGICEKKEPTTQDGKEGYYRDKLVRFHAKRNAEKRENIVIYAMRYLLITIVLGLLSIWLDGNWQLVMIVLAAVVGMISAYGFGMARGLRRK